MHLPKPSIWCGEQKETKAKGNLLFHQEMGTDLILTIG